VTTRYTVGQRDQRPWGTWEVIASEPRYTVKRIVVQPRKRLSLQSHAYRAEHWVVVGGAALVTRGSETYAVGYGGSVAIGRGEVHRIANPGPEELVFIEVQHGDRLDEDDITRFEDDHGRTQKQERPMNLSEFRATVAQDAPSDGLSFALRTLWWDAKGDWSRAHVCAQQDKGQTGSAVHAYLHRKEGDMRNAGGWYSRAGREVPTVSLDEEWKSLAEEMLALQAARTA
jgi:mannose-6-phosphate isomerase-like protein (cupin superfamily)